MSDSIQDRVLKVIATTRRVPIDSVTPDSTFEELGVDSLDRLNILFDLEGEFDIEIDDEEAKKVTDLHQMISGVTDLVNAKSAKPDGVDVASPSSSQASTHAPVASTVPPPVLPAGASGLPAPASVPETPLDPAVLPAPFHDPAETED